MNQNERDALFRQIKDKLSQLSGNWQFNAFYVALRLMSDEQLQQFKDALGRDDWRKEWPM